MRLYGGGKGCVPRNRLKAKIRRFCAEAYTMLLVSKRAIHPSLEQRKHTKFVPVAVRTVNENNLVGF
jgi:hypothetical protein